MNASSVLDLADAYAAVAVGETALQLGILDRLERGPATAVEVADDLALDRTSTARVLTALAGLGFLEMTPPDRFGPGPASWLPLRMALLDGLAERIRSGTPPAPFDTAAGANREYPKLVGLMAELFAQAADQAAHRLEHTGADVLEIGAGASPWSLALARRDPSRRVTVVDRPNVLEAARRAVDASGRGGAYTYRVADLSRDSLPEGTFDLVIAANVLHLFGPDANRRLTKQLLVALRPGGTVAIIDQMPDRPESCAAALLHAVTLLARTSEGDVHALSTYCTWLRDAGFAQLEHTLLTAPRPLSLLTATKPAQ